MCARHWKDEQGLAGLKGDLDWESKWWTPSEEEESKDKKDSWKVFKDAKPSVRRWWEEDWNEDEWWSPKAKSNSISSSKTTSISSSSSKKKGEDTSDLLTDTNQAHGDEASLSKTHPQQQKPEEKTDLASEPKALPLSSKPQTLSENSSGKKELDLPAAESPREKLDPVLKEDAISPFEDPKPGPYTGARDELPGEEKWEYHHPGGFGKYVDQGEDKADKKAADQKQAASSEMDAETKARVEAEIQREEDNRAVKIVEEDKLKVLDQFYGFGLEAGPASPPSKKEHSNKKVEAAVAKKSEPKPSKENYNHGIIYDVMPGAPPDRTHSVKKDLSNAEYMKEFVSTKSDLQTSPNPAPPGIAGKQATSEDTTPQAQTTKAEAVSSAKLVKNVKQSYIKSRPLTLCKYDDECHVGRMCHEGMCVCLPDNSCSGHFKPVCGSDGVQYPSHCELHRTACVKRVHIKIDHSGSCLVKPSKQKTDGKKEKSVDTAPWEHVQEETGDEFKSKKDKQVDNKEDYPQDEGLKECSEEELVKFKEELLAFHCKRFDEPDCKLELREDYELDHQELEAKQKHEKFYDLNPVCSLTDLIWYDDTMNADGQLSLDEFIAAFNKRPLSESRQQPVKTAPSPPVVHIIPTLATVGNGLELKCGLAAEGANVVWRRHGVNIRDLAMIELLVLDDGSLFFSKMGVHHMGNYSCEDPSDPSVLQVHSLKVQMPPVVKVSLHSQIEPAQVDVTVRCHAEGVPKPTITWQINNADLPNDPKHYKLTENSEVMTVHLTDYERDTGAYKCLAKNQAGTADDISTLFVLGDKDKTVGMGYTNVNSGTFAVFHAKGYTAYDADRCLKHRSVHGDFGYFKFIPDNLDQPLRLCEDGQACSWGSVVNVKNNFLYVSQPAMNRVVVIETTKNWIPVQVIATDKRPMRLHYVEHLDQVWVLCWNGEVDESTKTIVVVRDASKYVQHRAVHTQPVGNRFDQIQDLFIAPHNDLRHAFDYGYVTHNGQRGLTKLDLDNMRYTKTVDLSTYDCVPHSLAFVPIGGHVVVQCVSPLNHQTLQLVMDYITDAVVSTAVLAGKPYVSPDSRHVVTVDDFTGKVSVAGVNNEGILEQAYEVTVSASISDVAFFPLSGHGYLLVLTSADDDNIITISLATGKVDKLKGTMKQDTSSDWHPSPVKRTIVSGDFFSDFLLAPSKSSISIIDAKFRKVQCEFTDSPPSKAAVFVGLQ
nr:hypothetical protein BaRGS_003287 [Batillaria attramentaria]